MKKLFNFKNYLIPFLSLFILTIIYTLLIYLNILKTTNISYSIVTLLFGILTYFIISYTCTTNTTKKGWIKGLIVGLIITSILLIIKTFEGFSFSLSLAIKYMCFIFSSMFASIINVNKNKEK